MKSLLNGVHSHTFTPPPSILLGEVMKSLLYGVHSPAPVRVAVTSDESLLYMLLLSPVRATAVRSDETTSLRGVYPAPSKPRLITDNG